MWFESRLHVTIDPGSASSQGNCSLTPHSSGDFCWLPQEVVFPVGVATQTLTIQILDDGVAEGEETFHVQLVEGEGLVNAILHGTVRSSITITDMEDCKFRHFAMFWCFTPPSLPIPSCMHTHTHTHTHRQHCGDCG